MSVRKSAVMTMLAGSGIAVLALFVAIGASRASAQIQAVYAATGGGAGRGLDRAD